MASQEMTIIRPISAEKEEELFIEMLEIEEVKVEIITSNTTIIDIMNLDMH